MAVAVRPRRADREFLDVEVEAGQRQAAGDDDPDGGHLAVRDLIAEPDIIDPQRPERPVDRQQPGPVSRTGGEPPGEKKHALPPCHRLLRGRRKPYPGPGTPTALPR